MFHLISSYDAPACHDMLTRRRDRLQKEASDGFYSSDTKARISQALIFHSGHYIFMLITDQNERIQNEIENLIH